MKKIGRPTKYKPDFHAEEFIRLSNEGYTLPQIARQLNLHRETLYEWAKKYPAFSDSIKKGRQLCEAWYMDVGRRAMFGQMTLADKTGVPQKVSVNLGFFVWMTKNLFKWSDNVKLDAKVQDVESDQTKVEELSNWLGAIDKI